MQLRDPRVLASLVAGVACSAREPAPSTPAAAPTAVVANRVHLASYSATQPPAPAGFASAPSTRKPMSDRHDNRGDPEFPATRSPEELYAELNRAAADPKVFAVGLAIAFEHRTLHVPAGLPTTLAMIRQGIADGGKPIGYLWFDKAGLHATPLREWRHSEWAKGFLSMAGNELLTNLRSDTSGGHARVLRRNP